MSLSEAATMKKVLLLCTLVFAVVTTVRAQTPMQIYGVWHCYTDGCGWLSVPNMTTFDTDNHWIIDRGNGSPSVNVVVLSFVNPVDLMNLTNNSTTTNGIPIGMNTAVVNYFQSKGVRVMFSIGGIRFVKNWDKALSSNPTQLGINAANAAKQFNVGMEIDYEKSSNPNLTGLQEFITAYRSVIPYDPTGNNFAARLTIDLGNDDAYLQALSAYATTHWLSTSTPVLDYANAMVASQKTTVAALETGWSAHVDGVTGVPPLAPCQDDRKSVARRRHAELRHLQHFGSESGRQFRRDHCSERRWKQARHARHHVLGCRLPGSGNWLYFSAHHLRRRHGRRRHYV